MTTYLLLPVVFTTTHSDPIQLGARTSYFLL